MVLDYHAGHDYLALISQETEFVYAGWKGIQSNLMVREARGAYSGCYFCLFFL